MPKGRSQVGTFGSHLQHFARSVDIVDNQTVAEARSLVHEYLQKELSIGYFELLVEHTVNDMPGLRTHWSSADKNFSTTVKGTEGRYDSQLAVSFAAGKCLWIVNSQQQSLRRAETYIDMWSGVTDLPRYKPPVERDLRTSIMIPMRRPNDRILGVMYLESTEYLDIEQYDKDELALLADAMGVLIDLRDLYRVQAQGTRDAITDLRKIRETVVFPQIAKVQVFLAFSSRADQEVIGILAAVLAEFSGRLRVVQWNRIDDSGTITSQIAEAITSSRFGVCYLSEPGAGGQGYVDNPNVLFEAGMLHGLAETSRYERAGWIPVREEGSPPPFDLAGDRIELVPRLGDGRVNEAQFKTRLRGRLRHLLGD